VGGEIVKAEELIPHFEAVEQARVKDGKEVALTYFEFTTLAILRLMSLSRLDVAILEVGLGGRLDATNIIDADCAIITSVDLDHMELLGPTAKASAAKKPASCVPAVPSSSATRCRRKA
jgi:dihydrofolate synthase/folylpolyglutamate synthase